MKQSCQKCGKSFEEALGGTNRHHWVPRRSHRKSFAKKHRDTIIWLCMVPCHGNADNLLLELELTLNRPLTVEEYALAIIEFLSH